MKKLILVTVFLSTSVVAQQPDNDAIELCLYFNDKTIEYAEVADSLRREYLSTGNMNKNIRDRMKVAGDRLISNAEQASIMCRRIGKDSFADSMDIVVARNKLALKILKTLEKKANEQ